MKYYSEETIKQMLKDTKVISITRNMYGNIVQDFRIVRPKIEDYPSIEDDNPWHTGTPTEEGWYLVQHLTDAEYCGSKFFVARWDGEKFVINPRPPIVVTYPNGTAWRKIEDEEASNG